MKTPNPTYTQLPPPSQSEIRLTIPLVPPSVNHYVKHTRSGRHYVTQEAKAFKEAICILAAGKAVTAKRYAVVLKAFFGKGHRGDVDNLGKCVLDGLVSAGCIHSDAAVDELTIQKFRDWENPRTEITVRAL